MLENKSESETLNQIGEEKILNRLKKYMDIGQIEDDTALIQNCRKDLIINTDILVENIHFNNTTSFPNAIGWKAVAVNISDLAASGFHEFLGITVGLVCPPSTPWSWVDGVYEGIKNALDTFGGKLLGGDCSNGKQKMLSITAIGTKGILDLHRSNARPGDLLVASGPHGLSRLGLALLISDPIIKDANLSLGLQKKAIKTHQRPEPPVDALKKLLECKPKNLKWKAAAIDSSDGLLEAVESLCKSSECGAILEKNKLPTNKGWPSGSHWDQLCLIGGEDYELIVSLPPRWAQAWIKAMPSSSVIGRMVKGNPKAIWSNGQEIKKEYGINCFKHF
ncbi:MULTISPECIES: thiamine-phosphate kinase [unclassified Prochlorococcus]|uniref:thiamine-phosphate kinase n=1 Tax=unclassified Prochlorococcus TaxID=2627481 RepID=UPI000533ADA4|nr:MULTISPECIES: thiamine-phosphate kinase [unclassified Prochlorococcus]KGG16925.1 Thiamine-monophosphate kinase [Prochlorococcus sp. MIT 0602]KGG18099.1 Thiamine-monophosphate kinase [Prochlorococcus sp. MIT 0603]